jgi:hypothetical protein
MSCFGRDITLFSLHVHPPTQPPSLKLRRPTDPSARAYGRRAEALAKVGEATAARPS